MKNSQVRFSFVIVHEFEDDVAAKEGRCKYWEYFAIDRLRFKDRITTCAISLNPFLEKKCEIIKSKKE